MTELNQKIHEWLGLHWHEFNNDCICQVDGCVADNDFRNQNPDYTTDPAAMLELIEAVRAKGFDVEMFSDANEWLVCISVTGSGANEMREVSDTLPMAVARAVEKLIDSEGK